MINQIDDSTNLFINNNLHKKNNADNDLFRQSLEKALVSTKIPDTKDAASESSLKEISSVSSRGWSMNNKNLNLESKTVDLLKMLDEYSLQLKNDKISLKKIEPFLKEIKNNANDLLKEAASATSADTKLKNIAEQCAVTASTEYFKFQRGDYI